MRGKKTCWYIGEGSVIDGSILGVMKVDIDKSKARVPLYELSDRMKSIVILWARVAGSVKVGSLIKRFFVQQRRYIFLI